MTDLLGPAVARATTVRPTESRLFGTDDTWFRPCENGVAGTGTPIPAAYLNGVLAQIRAAIRGAGVTENNADDEMLWKAIQSVTSETLGRYRVPFSTAESMTATTPPPTPAQGDAYIPAATATGAWAGLEDEFVWWSGDDWFSAPVPIGTLIHAIDTAITWRRTATGWERFTAEKITNRVYYATPGSSTFTVPAGVTKVFVTVAGGGGGGNAHQNTPIAGGTGGTSSFGAYVSATGGEGGYYGPDVREPGIGVGGDINIVGGGGIGGEGAIAFGPSQPDGVNDGVWGKNGGKAMKTVTVTPGAGITVTVGAAGSGAVSDSDNFFWTDGVHRFHGSSGQAGYVLIEW